MKRQSLTWHGGALVGLALLVANTGNTDEMLREEIRRDFRDQSYLLVEDADGATLYLFDNSNFNEPPIATKRIDIVTAVAKTQSVDARVRTRGLAELAGIDDDGVLNVGLSLLADPDPAVRDEAKYLILDHPDGAALAASLGLVDDELGE